MGGGEGSSCSGEYKLVSLLAIWCNAGRRGRAGPRKARVGHPLTKRMLYRGTKTCAEAAFPLQCTRKEAVSHV